MQIHPVCELKEKDEVESFYLVKEKSLGVGKNGRSFLTLLLGDKTGNIDSKLWDRVEELSKLFETGDIVKIKGVVQVYQNRKQLILHKIETVDQGIINMDEFIQKSHLNVNDMFSELINLVKTLKNDHIKQLILDTLEDPEIKPRVLRSPAAKSIHHAWEGGLLEHILSICKIMNFLSEHYTFLNRDLLIFGAVFHDIGKIWELEIDNSISYTDRGRLIGHMHMSCELVDKKTARILGFNSELVDILKHIILSHHGKLEFGSPKRPKFLEALVVSMVDELDSRVISIFSFIKDERLNSDKWSRFNEMYDRYFYLEDMNEKLT